MGEAGGSTNPIVVAREIFKNDGGLKGFYKG
jgi:hypothetical protein